ncbi:MAG: glycosyltransferase family 4 protein, partial [Pyrinomonadaceae bacterium]
MTFHLCTSDAKNRLALDLLVPRMHANVAVSHELLNCLNSEAGFDTSERFHVVHNGVDQRRLKPTGIDLRKELELPGSTFLVGMVGNFYPDRRKDQLTICQALPEFFAAVPHAHVLFAGGDFPPATEMQKCTALCHELNVADRVHFLGKRTDIPDVLHSLDIYVQSSVNEALPIAVVEALLAGLPVIVSDIGSLLEATGEFAVTFRTSDPRDLASKLIGLASDHRRRTELAQKGKDFALQQFTIEKHISRLIELYNTV